ncbi:MAG: sensor histidine kinase, partial [Nannocystaceae bacterium]
FSEVLHDLANGEQKADLARILAAANHLSTLINDVLELSRIEAGRSRVDLRRFVLATLLEQAIAYAKKCNPDAVTTVVLPESLELGEMISDRAKVAQIFENLLDNAVKFTPDGTVTLSVEQTSADPAEMLFTITDNGIGMDEDTLAQLFTAFYQADSSATRPYGGAGIGLTITEQFCRLLGGKIEVTSQLGEGSTFRVYLPRELVVG